MQHIIAVCVWPMGMYITVFPWHTCGFTLHIWYIYVCVSHHTHACYNVSVTYLWPHAPRLVYVCVYIYVCVCPTVPLCAYMLQRFCDVPVAPCSVYVCVRVRVYIFSWRRCVCICFRGIPVAPCSTWTFLLQGSHNQGLVVLRPHPLVGLQGHTSAKHVCSLFKLPSRTNAGLFVIYHIPMQRMCAASSNCPAN